LLGLVGLHWKEFSDKRRTTNCCHLENGRAARKQKDSGFPARVDGWPHGTRLTPEAFLRSLVAIGATMFAVKARQPLVLLLEAMTTLALNGRHRSFLYHQDHFVDDTIGYRAPLRLFYCPAYIVKLLLDLSL